MAEFLCESLVSVRSVKVKVRQIPQEELAVRAAKTKDVSIGSPACCWGRGVGRCRSFACAMDRSVILSGCCCGGGISCPLRFLGSVSFSFWWRFFFLLFCVLLPAPMLLFLL